MSQMISSPEAEPVSPGIPDYRITDLKSFEEATKGPEPLLGTSIFQIMDCLVDLACKVLADFRKRPQLVLLLFTALYIQIDARIWNGICQLLARLMIGTNS